MIAGAELIVVILLAAKAGVVMSLAAEASVSAVTKLVANARLPSTQMLPAATV